jgi:hypothetical protein
MKILEAVIKKIDRSCSQPAAKNSEAGKKQAFTQKLSKIRYLNQKEQRELGYPNYFSIA